MIYFISLNFARRAPIKACQDASLILLPIAAVFLADNLIAASDIESFYPVKIQSLSAAKFPGPGAGLKVAHFLPEPRIQEAQIFLARERMNSNLRGADLVII